MVRQSSQRDGFYAKSSLTGANWNAPVCGTYSNPTEPLKNRKLFVLRTHKTRKTHPIIVSLRIYCEFPRWDVLRKLFRGAAMIATVARTIAVGPVTAIVEKIFTDYPRSLCNCFFLSLFPLADALPVTALTVPFLFARRVSRYLSCAFHRDHSGAACRHSSLQ
jgi:hypothetical protein